MRCRKQDQQEPTTTAAGIAAAGLGRCRRGGIGRGRRVAIGPSDRLRAARPDREAIDGRLLEASLGVGSVTAILRDHIARMIAIPQHLERVHILAAIVGRARVIEVDVVAGHVVRPAVHAHRVDHASPVVEVDGAPALVVRLADGRGIRDVALACEVPLIEQVLLRDRAQRAVDRDRRVCRHRQQIVARITHEIWQHGVVRERDAIGRGERGEAFGVLATGFVGDLLRQADDDDCGAAIVDAL
jgi:hypothetical protein